ncbi:hypothetical protein OS493_024044 [Desmophyllum pertusum]|uniref:Uncharacterized protein n=1 Tax=Desmophyllum pertusum TaxID=174260 RepID=A0A9X0D224_9CNID|nr:hypothetical protein OS493_024044 [Desmophyllum pertusum]
MYVNVGEMYCIVINDLPLHGLGRVETFSVATNKTKVHFFVKAQVPTDQEELATFIQKLARVGVNLRSYTLAYESNNLDSIKHCDEYMSRKDTNSPSKRQRTE